MNPLRLACLVSIPALTALAQPAGWAPNFTTAVAWNSNATNADRDSDVIGALLFRADVEIFSQRLALGRDDSLNVGLAGAAEAWSRFDGLNRAELGVRLAWRHKFGLGAFAPVLSVELSGDRVAARDTDRSGSARGARLAWQQRLGEATQLELSYEQRNFGAREGIYDRTGGEAAAAVTRELNERWQLAFTARWRKGDVLSYATPPRPDLVAVARDRTLVDTFDRPLMAYSVRARTIGGTLALVRALDERSSLAFGYEGLVTERRPLRYVNHLVSATFTRQY